jgi:hypothetical protein
MPLFPRTYSNNHITFRTIATISGAHSYSIIIVYYNNSEDKMVSRRSALINFCAAPLCGSKCEAAAAQNSRSNLRRRAVEVTAFSPPSSPSLGQTPGVKDTHLNEPTSAARLLADVASSAVAFGIASSEAVGSSEFEYTESTPFYVPPVVSPEMRNSNVLFKEDFCSVSDLFTASDGNDVAYYKSTFGREGVVRIKNSNGYIATGNILSPSSSFSTFTVTFSYHTNSMEEGSGFCLDFSTDGGHTWHDEECYDFGEDFENGFWYDDIGVEFHAEDIGLEDSLSIRLISKGNSHNDDVLFDKIQVVGSA